MEKKKGASHVESEHESDVENKQPDIEIIDKNNDELEQAESLEQEQHSIDELESKTKELQEEKDELYNKLVRLQAEYDNYKKRTQKEKQSDRKYKSQELVTELLPAIDNFDRALQIEVTEENSSFIDGMSMVYRQIQEALEKQGVEEIQSVGEEFDPTIHHAVMQVEDEEKESNVILEEMQKGYMLKDRVIRPAMVKVNK